MHRPPRSLHALLAAAALPLAALPVQPTAAAEPGRASGKTDCRISAGPDDRVAQDQDLVIPAGVTVHDAIVLRGRLVLEPGAHVRKAVAAGGTITLRPGAVVEEDAVAIGGDVVLEGHARVGGDAVALGGQVKVAPGASVVKSVVALSLELGGTSLARSVLEGIKAQGRCEVVPEAK